MLSTSVAFLGDPPIRLLVDATMGAHGRKWFLYAADEIYGTDRRVPSVNILKTIKKVAPEIRIGVTCDIDYGQAAAS